MKMKTPAPGQGRIRSWQTADTGLGFNGQDNGSSQRAQAPNKVMTNQWSGHMNDGRDVQFGQMPNRTGNQSKMEAGRRQPPATAKSSANPVDSGARKWDPKCEQNYVGNPDRIQERQMYNKTGNKE
jgi:hypothetical protein